MTAPSLAPRTFAPPLEEGPALDQAFVRAILARGGHENTIALISAPGHMEDHQVIAHLAAAVMPSGGHARLGSPRDFEWTTEGARLRTRGETVPVEPTLISWQRRGIEIWQKSSKAEMPATPIKIHQTPWPLRLVHFVQSTFLRRGDDDAFGMFVEHPGSG